MRGKERLLKGPIGGREGQRRRRGMACEKLGADDCRCRSHRHAVGGAEYRLGNDENREDLSNNRAILRIFLKILGRANPLTPSGPREKITVAGVAPRKGTTGVAVQVRLGLATPSYLCGKTAQKEAEEARLPKGLSECKVWGARKAPASPP